MILLLLYFVFCLLWFKGKKALSLVFFYASITNCFNFKIAATNYDLTYLSFAVGTFSVISYLRNRKNDVFVFSVENSVVLLYLFMGLHAYFTMLLGIESPKYSFVVFRVWGIISVFLLCQTFNASEIDKSLKYLFVVNVVWLVLYYLQFAGVNLFVEESFRTAFKRNTPHLTMFFAIYAIFMLKNKTKCFFIPAFLYTTFTAGARGSLVGFIGAFVVFYAAIKKSKKILVIGVIALICQNYIMIFFQKSMLSRNGNLSFSDEILNGFNLDYRNFHGMLVDGTFAYRTLYLYERFDYLLNHPKNILFGIGSIYETSPNNYMHFYIQHSGRIETDDLFWATPLLRYGLVGIGLYAIFFTSYFAFFVRQNPNEKWVKMGSIFFLMLLFTSMQTWSFAAPANILVMGMCYYRVKNSFENELENFNHA